MKHETKDKMDLTLLQIWKCVGTRRSTPQITTNLARVSWLHDLGAFFCQWSFRLSIRGLVRALARANEEIRGDPCSYENHLHDEV